MVERYQMHQSLLNDMPVHKYIPMERLDLIQPNQVRILYYQNPSRFYVYLRQKINSHAQFQVELQRAMQNYRSVSPPPHYQRYQPVAAQDNHEIWHRATILDYNPNSPEISVYFVDVGQEENISISNIRPLSNEFIRQPAFAIPCRLYGIYPLNGNEESNWRLDDLVHDEFNQQMSNNANCKVCDIKEQICYDVEIDIPKVGDLGTYLFEQNFVSRINMRTTPTSQQSFGRIPPGFSGIQPVPPPTTTTRLLQKPTVQQSPSTPTSSDVSSDISTLSPQDGNYIITQVYSAIEFYGYSQGREKELNAFHKHLETIYNNTNDQSLSVHFIMDGVPCVIQQGETYHRVTIKHRESESRVSVKLIDRGDEIIVDTSELLQLDKKYFTIPAFAQPFRLYKYDESHSTANITRKLKRLILNQRVSITQHLPTIHGFYPVEVNLSDNQSVNQILLSNDIIPMVPPPPPPPVKPVEVQTNEDLPAPQKLLTAPVTANRFGTNEQTSRFARPQQDESNSPVNGAQPLMSEQNRPYSRGFSTDRNENNNRGGRNNDEIGGQRSGGFSRNGEQRSERFNQDNEGDRSGQRFARFNRDNGEIGGQRSGGFSRNGDENGEQRSGRFNRDNGEIGGQRSGGFSRNGDENGEQRSGRFNRDNEGDGGGQRFARFNRNNDENDGQKSGGFNRNGGGGFADRGNRNGFSDRNQENRNDENDGQRSGGFNRNGGGGFADRGNRNGFSDRNQENRNDNNGPRPGGFANRGARNGEFQDRNNRFRNNQDDDNNNNNGQRFASRGGFNGERRGGGFGERGGSRGGRGGRPGGFGERSENNVRINSDANESGKTFSGWPNMKPARFEAGDNFIENEIPREEFQFVISHIEKSNDFFIQLYSKEKELSKLSETLQNEYKDAPELNTNSIKINQACLAKSSDNCWYRAKILSTDLPMIKIRFIDFGDTYDIDIKTIRQLAKKFCSTSPYAYRCLLKDVEENENMNTNEIIQKCAEQKFNGKIEKNLSNDKYILQSDNFQKLMIDINAIKLKPLLNTISCVIVYIDEDKHQFYIQDDSETMDKITDEVKASNIELSLDDIQINSMVISTFEDEPYRAIIQSDLDDNVSVYFVDFGNTNICLKSSLKKCSEELQNYPHQAKRCQLYDISSNDLDEAFKQLDEYMESDQTEYLIVNKNDEENLFFINLYINHECFNDKFSNETSIDMSDQSSTTTATTVKEQERPIVTAGKRNNEEILSPVGNSSTTTSNIKRQKSQSETEGNSTICHKAILTHIDKDKSLIYLQLLPESEEILGQINSLIGTIVEENKHNSLYEIGDYVIAQFTDDNHYRARIESYDSSKELYTVYFLDYGNVDENVPKDRLYSYTDELKEIELLTHGYTLENFQLIESKINDEIEFYYIDKINSIIQVKLDNENLNSNQPKTFSANISGTNNDCFYIHILPETDTLICEIDELLQSHSNEYQQANVWNINDLCIVFDCEQEQYFRGKILSNENEQYNIQCIDHGNILNNISKENLYLLPDDDLLKQKPLARQCRLHGVNEQDQSKAIEEVIRNISATECVTVTVENEQNDQCMYVMLFRENNEIVNDRYINQENEIEIKKSQSTNSTDSAIDTSNDHQITSPIGTPQAESTHQYSDTTNRTIDFGENDSPTSNTTIKDETENDS